MVGIGASAGGLDACRALVSALPAETGMAFILIQHLDPMHESMMVGLLSEHTRLVVVQAVEGMPVEREHLYLIPPGAFLSTAGGILRVSRPEQRHGARLPFDFLLASLAEDCGRRAFCIVLSGSGADGSLGAEAVRTAGGRVIVQDPEEAAYDGMPLNAIAAGVADEVLPISRMPAALAAAMAGLSEASRPGARGTGGRRDDLDAMLALLQADAHDFTTYKKGTLHRRIERRMAIANVDPEDTSAYLAILRDGPEELDLLAKDLLIHVTSFFRDGEIFALLERETIPALLQNCTDGSIRIWIAGCSTGEETYSLAILIREAILAAGRDVRVQIFASDVDPGAVATAREGLYDASIANEVSRDRLTRFFVKEDGRYRVSPGLRSTVVFTVQDVLVDPPFACLDMISCRNLLIYLNLDAQMKVMSLFHFALNERGVLLLGAAETVGRAEGRFEVVSKPGRVYRKVGRGSAADLGFALSGREGRRASGLNPSGAAPAPRPTLEEICRRAVLEAYAPAAVLIDARNECVFHLGATDAYLRVSSGVASHGLLEMVPTGMRTKLRTAIEDARRTGSPARARATGAARKGAVDPFDIAVEAVPGGEDGLLLVCFIDVAADAVRDRKPVAGDEVTRVVELERELEATKAELNGAIRDLERSGEDQKAVNEEALSFNEEYQSTNEELITSKEELQSFNEELAALNGQLQEALEKQRTAADDLQNVLYSTDVATLFLDEDQKIRFFTPATKALFSVITGDVGRPLDDLRALVPDDRLPGDIRAVIAADGPVEREIQAGDGTWFIRRVMPYRGHDRLAGGVVITFTDITDRKRGAVALEAAKRQAETATLAKSRFLAAASHDLRQPLQTLALIHGLLAQSLEGGHADKLIAGLEDTLGAMSGMLNTLLDVNQIEAGTVQPDIVCFPVDDLLERMRHEFAYVAESRRLVLKVVSCRLSVRSDPRILEQMIRNLLSNALKYTREGAVLLGCRRRGGALRIEIWDTGEGIQDKDLASIFEEYHQLDNGARERSRGLGLGLSIVRSLATLLDHRISVASRPGSGSVFAVEVAIAPAPTPGSVGDGRRRLDRDARPDTAPSRRAGEILVVEDDPEIRGLLALLLRKDGHGTRSAADGASALASVSDGIWRPDVIIADYNLPDGLNGLEAAAKIQDRLLGKIPVIILTGDISTDALRAIAAGECRQLNKPVHAGDLIRTIQDLLRAGSDEAAPTAASRGRPSPDRSGAVVFVVDDDEGIRTAMRGLFEARGRIVEDFPDGEAFFARYEGGREACLLVDACLPGMSGLDLLRRLRLAGHSLPAVMITGQSDVPMAVEAMKAGASDFIEKPVKADEMVASVERALDRARDVNKSRAWREDAARLVANLTRRQRQIMDLVLAGQPSKNIAADLGISQRTVENHRASIMDRTGSKSLPALARLALAASPVAGSR